MPLTPKQQELAEALSYVNVKAGGMEPTQLKILSSARDARFATLPGAQKLELVINDQHMEFTINSKNDRSILTCHDSILIAKDDSSNLRYLPTIFSELSKHSLINNITALQFPIALFLKSKLISLRLRAHALHLVIYKTVNNTVECAIVDSTVNPIGVGNLVAFLFSYLTDISTIQAQLQTIMSETVLKENLARILGCAKESTEAIPVHPVFTGAQSVFFDKSCAVYTLQGQLELAETILSAEPTSPLDLNTETILGVLKSAHQQLHCPIVKKGAKQIKTEREAADRLAARAAIAEMIDIPSDNEDEIVERMILAFEPTEPSLVQARVAFFEGLKAHEEKAVIRQTALQTSSPIGKLNPALLSIYGGGLASSATSATLPDTESLSRNTPISDGSGSTTAESPSSNGSRCYVM
jgi:hypothetical protein